jgi:putative ABC transport system substrate-binding protein
MVIFSRGRQQMRRREFIALFGGAAAAWPRAARAQQRPAMPVVGYLKATPLTVMPHTTDAFRRGLAEAGFVEGRNVAIEFRSADGQWDRLPALAADLVRRRVNVIVAGPAADQVAKAATTTIPIVVMSGTDPVRRGLVPSLNRPGGNLTGVTMFADDLEAKRIGLLHEFAPRAAIAVLVDMTIPLAAFQIEQAQAAGRSIGAPIRIVSIGSARDYEAAFASMVQERTGALLVAASINFNSVHERLIALAARHGIPAMYEIREFAAAGGLMSYAPSVTEAYRQVGVYTGRVLKGDKPADLPVMLPTRFELVINLKTSKALGLEVPPMLLARADEVIE